MVEAEELVEADDVDGIEEVILDVMKELDPELVGEEVGGTVNVEDPGELLELKLDDSDTVPD